MTPATRVARTVEVRRFARRGSCTVSWLVRAGMSAVRWKVNGGKQRQRSRCGRWASRWQWRYRVLGGRVWRVWRHGFPRYRVQAGMVEKGGIGTVGIAKFLAESRPGIQKPPCSIKGPAQDPYSRLRLRIRCSIVCRLTGCSAVPIVPIVHIHTDSQTWSQKASVGLIGAGYLSRMCPVPIYTFRLAGNIPGCRDLVIAMPRL